jgi:riboflavin transporter FmnP
MTSGAILGAGLLIFTLILYITNLTYSKGLGYLSYLIIIGGIILGIKNFRDHEQQGFITYGKAVGAGVLTVVFASIIMAIFNYILFKVIDPNLIEKGMEIARTQMMEKNLNDDQIEMAMKMTRTIMSPGVMAIITILGNAFMGTIFSLIIAAFMKKDKNIFNQPTENTQL